MTRYKQNLGECLRFDLETCFDYSNTSNTKLRIFHIQLFETNIVNSCDMINARIVSSTYFDTGGYLFLGVFHL